MAKAPKHPSHRWDDEDDPPVNPPPVVEKTEAKDFVPPPTVKVKCITHLHPWTQLKHLEMDEVADVTQETADLLIANGFVEMYVEAPPPEDAK